ncbi:hypothetical protein [Methylobacter tundripaludum]|uniref:hypothetical protein n=1 Tax=Methylobacter tundripaludum TaxID=173365 RepID=UPI0004DF4126|nr:hypothetical protein [Methylobacter tundripaludum]
MSPEDVNQVLGLFKDFILRYGITLAGIGTFSMALLEAFKSLFSWRDRWHRWKLCEWVNSVECPPWAIGETGDELLATKSAFHYRVYTQLILLTTGQNVDAEEMDRGFEVIPWDISQSNALFALELEKLMGQVQDAADMALGHPHKYKELYLFLTADGDVDDIKYWGKWAQLPPVSTDEDPVVAKHQADTYSSIRQFIRRRLDAFQLTTSYRWQTINQIASVVLGSVLLFASLVFLDKNNNTDTNWFVLITISLMGGIIAPISKDLVVALQRMRNGG